MRPRSLDEFAGQAHLVGPGKPLRRVVEGGRLHSMIFWGPPGTGKTTLARLLASNCGHEFVGLSAVLAGVKDVRTAVELAQRIRTAQQRGTVLFLDEVHRFNKAQQDSFLPFVEDGTLILIGATTENPSFEVNSALLSRARVYVLKSLTREDLGRVIDAALADSERGLGALQLEVEPQAREIIVTAADGDARRTLNLLELAADLAEPAQRGAATAGSRITTAIAADVASGGYRRFDKGGDQFYDQISALHKSVRGSDPDAALYWLARMLDGGCDPLYVARRVVRMASEDIGNADPRGLAIALDAWNTFERLGTPEGELAIAQAVVYLAVAPKSNAVYTAFGAARDDVKQFGTLDVPLHLRNAPTRLMKDLGYGRDYRHAHDEPDAFAAGEQYFPEAMGKRPYYYCPVPRGLEIKIAEALARFRQRNSSSGDEDRDTAGNGNKQ